jgi:periplasmic divalent cation tolerance protein
MEEQFCVMMTTYADPSVGRRLIDGLLSQRLAACVQSIEISSAYRWKGAVHNDKEVLLLIKTRASLYPQVEAFIKANHNYEVPEIVKVDITGGFPAYLNWITEECAR